MIRIYADIQTFVDSILHKPFMAWYTLCFTLNVKWFSIISVTRWILASCQFPISVNYLVINQTLWGYCSIHLITTGIHKLMSAAWKIFFFFFCLLFKLMLVFSGITAYVWAQKQNNHKKLLAATKTHINPTAHTFLRRALVLYFVVCCKTKKRASKVFKKTKSGTAKQCKGNTNS